MSGVVFDPMQRKVVKALEDWVTRGEISSQVVKVVTRTRIDIGLGESAKDAGVPTFGDPLRVEGYLLFTREDRKDLAVFFSLQQGRAFPFLVSARDARRFLELNLALGGHEILYQQTTIENIRRHTDSPPTPGSFQERFHQQLSRSLVATTGRSVEGVVPLKSITMAEALKRFVPRIADPCKPSRRTLPSPGVSTAPVGRTP